MQMDLNESASESPQASGGTSAEDNVRSGEDSSARSAEDNRTRSAQPAESSGSEKDQPDRTRQQGDAELPGEAHEQTTGDTKEDAGRQEEEDEESASEEELTHSSSEPESSAGNASMRRSGVGVHQTNLESDNFSQTNTDQPTSERLSYGRTDLYSTDKMFRIDSHRIDKQTQLDPNELTSKLADLKVNERFYDTMIPDTQPSGHLPDLINNLVVAKQPQPQPPQQPEQADSSAASDEIPSYQVKWIKFRGKQCAIIMQNVNGCCPLLAIMNVLLLRGKIQLPLSTKLVTYDQVIVFLANFILENGTNSAPEGLQLDYEQNINDAMQLFPKLQTGLDVNVQFNSVTSFEYTSEMIIFDLLGISLYHGWIVDRDDLETVTVIGSCSYNQLVDKIITNKSSARSEEVSEALIAERFLESTASQLTYFGLSELVSNVREQELSILFRNNHFITLYKNQNQLYQLVTDQGFMQEPDVVWMTLSHIDNDDTFLNSEFKPSSVAVKSNSLSPTEQKKQIDQDYLIALSIEEEEKKQAAAAAAQVVDPFREERDLNRDEFLARQLQEEEDRLEVQEYEQKRAMDLQLRKLQAKRELDGRQPVNYNERFPQQHSAAATAAPPSNRQPLNRSDSADTRGDYSRNKPGNLHPNSSAPSENHTQSSSSGRGVHRNNHHHNSSNHGHHKKNNCVIS